MLSVIIPALNEEASIRETIETIQKSLTDADIIYEIIVINDGSIDATGKIIGLCEKQQDNLQALHHPKSGGYGHSIKEGILKAKYDMIAITDADGTYPNHMLPEFYNTAIKKGYDMVVGARRGTLYRGTFLKMPSRRVFLWLCEYATGRKIADINSGLRVFKKEIPIKFMKTISNGFSFTTTITLAALLNGYFVEYIPIDYFKRAGKSHVRIYRDTLRTAQIIIENILYYNPLKLFLLQVNILFGISIASFVLFIISNSKKFSIFFGCFSGFCFASAFIVAAIGLAADLDRIKN